MDGFDAFNSLHTIHNPYRRTHLNAMYSPTDPGLQNLSGYLQILVA